MIFLIFGSLLAPFGSLVAPFGSLLAPFECQTFKKKMFLFDFGNFKNHPIDCGTLP
jgi:hypothetical protein